MKKRLLCLLMALFMAVSLVPAAALSASAATLSVSESAIFVLKQLEGYSRYCDKNGYIGYGTPCDGKGDHGKKKKHEADEIEADKALREVLKDLDKAVNSFASKKGLSLTQGQHDAMVLFSFQNGTAWTTGTGDLQSAITSKAKGSEFLSAICRWSSSDDDNRRKIEANMYLNGVYSSSVPSQFITVKLEPNGGTMSQSATQYYDVTTAQPVGVIPTNGTQTFMGWYLSTGKDDEGVFTDGTAVTKVTKAYDGKTLVARWQKANGETDSVNYLISVSDLASRTHRLC